MSDYKGKTFSELKMLSRDGDTRTSTKNVMRYCIGWATRERARIAFELRGLAEEYGDQPLDGNALHRIASAVEFAPLDMDASVFKWAAASSQEVASDI